MPGQPWLAYQNQQPQAQAVGKPWERYAQPERAPLAKADRLDAKPLSWKETADDYANAIGSNVTKSVLAIPGLPGDVINLGSKAAAGWAGILGSTPEQAYALERKLTEHAPPTTEELTPVGLNYDPKTEGAHWAGTAAGIGTAALAGPGSLARKGVQTAVTTAATELGGPYAGLAASVITGGRGGAGIKRPTTAQLKATTDKAYAAARADGTIVPPEAFSEIVNRVKKVALEEGVDPDLTPKAAKLVEKLTAREGTPKTLDELDKTRQIIGHVAGDASPSERRLGMLMRNAYDEGVDSVATHKFAEARKANREFKNSEMVDNLNHKIDLKSAQNTNSGQENATRTVYRNLANNESKMRKLDAPTREAVDRVAMGGKVENAARWGGKFAPTGVLPVLTAISTGRLDLAAALMAPGALSRAAATLMTGKNKRLAEALIKMGGKDGMTAFKNAEDKRRLEALVQRLIVGDAAAQRSGPYPSE